MNATPSVIAGHPAPVTVEEHKRLANLYAQAAEQYQLAGLTFLASVYTEQAKLQRQFARLKTGFGTN